MTFDVMVPRNGQKLADTHFQTIKEFQMWKYLVQLLPGHLSRDYKLLSPSSRWDDDQAERQTRNLVCILLLRQAQHSFYWWAWYLLHTLSDTELWTCPYWAVLAHCTATKLVIHHILGILCPHIEIFSCQNVWSTLFMSSRSWLCVVDKVVSTLIVGFV